MVDTEVKFNISMLSDNIRESIDISNPDITLGMSSKEIKAYRLGICAALSELEDYVNFWGNDFIVGDKLKREIGSDILKIIYETEEQ